MTDATKQEVKCKCGHLLADHLRGRNACGCLDCPCEVAEPKKPGLFSKLGSAVGEAVGSWFAGRQ
jgi:hypothetical protein